jgi:hypothetical protein
LLEHALFLDFATHLGDQLHIYVLLHHDLVDPENVGEERNYQNSVDMIHEILCPVDPNEN